MLDINGNRITITHGDTLTLTVLLKKDGEIYEPEPGDVIRFAISQGFKGGSGYELKLVKQIPINDLTFTITADEMSRLDTRTYNYDVEVTHSDGCVDTVLISTITLTNEVE